MTSTLVYLLLGHIVGGLTGTICFYIVWRDSLKKQPHMTWLQYLSLLGVSSYIVAWVTGGYYYLTYYGKAVQPVIKAGLFPWAHTIVMETKEHLFFFLPLLAIVVTVTLWLLPNEMQQEAKLKQAVAGLSGVISILGIAMLLSGLAISGAVR